jgi:hypothetical protein
MVIAATCPVWTLYNILELLFDKLKFVYVDKFRIKEIKCNKILK